MGKQAISKELRRYLPRGYGQELATQFQCSVSKIYHVVTGQLTDYRILEALLDIIQKNTAIEKKLARQNLHKKEKAMIEIYKDWDFPDTQYVRQKTEKKQIVLHHTVSGDKVDGDTNWWLHTPERVATSYIISREGHLHKCFDDEYWAYHLGLSAEHFNRFGISYHRLDPSSIGIELDSWGALLQHTDGLFYPVTRQNGKTVPNLKCKPVKNIYEYCSNQKYRGFQYFERYTTAQLDALKRLLNFLMDKHQIPANYKSDIWNVTPRALMGWEGIFAHSSYRQDKSDVHPQVELVNLLKSL